MGTDNCSLTPIVLEQRFAKLSSKVKRDFFVSIQPGAAGILGVPMPDVRREVRPLLKAGAAKAYLSAALKPGAIRSQEGFFAAAIVAGRGRGLTAEERLAAAEALVPLIDGWARCDLLGSEIKVFREDRARFWPVIEQYLNHPNPWAVRLAQNWILWNYRESEWIPRALGALEGEHVLGLARDSYYLSMSLAWCVSMLYTVEGKACERWLTRLLQDQRIDAATARRTVSKIRDSFQVSKADKAALSERLRPLIAAPGLAPGAARPKAT
jgi:hypothetical protein